MSISRTGKVRGLAIALAACMIASLIMLGIAPAGAATVTNNYAVPTASSNPIGIAYGPDGNMWFTEAAAGNVARITPGGAFTEFHVGAPADQLMRIASGPDGYIWFTMMVANRVGKISPDGSDVHYYDLGIGSYPVGIVAGSDGAMWVTESLSNKVSRVTVGGAITSYIVPTGGAQPSGIAAGPDGALWFVEYNPGKIGRLTTAGSFHEYATPTAGSGPTNIAAGSDGALWFNEQNSNKIGRVTTSGAFTEYAIPTGGAQPDNVTLGPDGAIWFTEYFADKIGRISTTGTVAEYPFDTAIGPRGIAAGTDNTVWFTSYNNYISRMDIGTPTWYLAEGTDGWGFNTYVSVQNPNASTVHADVTYMTPSGPISGARITLPAASQATIFPRDAVGAQDFSTKIECVEAKTIAVDRTMMWTGAHSSMPEAHSSIGVTSPAQTWYLAEGSSSWGFETWLLIQNPGATAASCNVTYMIEGEGPRSFVKTVPAHTRQTFNMANDIGSRDASIKVTSSAPVIAERAMYRYDRREGHDSIGTTSPSPEYYLAEGTTAWGFTTYVLVQNPNPSPSSVTVTYMTSSGPIVEPPFVMEANSRRTIRVNDVLPNRDLSTKVVGTQPIIAERAMYYMSEAGETCHDSIGLAQAHKTFCLPDGCGLPDNETWTLVQNPNSTPVSITITYMTPSGTGNRTRNDTIPANTRRTYLMSDTISGRAAVMVSCTTSGKKIMVERAMYWSHRTSATDTIGGFSDL